MGSFAFFGRLLRQAGVVSIALIGALGASPAIAVAPAAGSPEDAVLCVPEAIQPVREADLLVAPNPASLLPFRVIVPNLVRLEPTPVVTSPGLIALQGRLQRMVSETNVPGRFATAITDLQTGETIGVGLDRPQLSGCAANLFAIIVALRDVDSGRLSLESVDETIRETIRASNATTARDLFVLVGHGDPVAGVRRVSALYDQLGMLSSVIDHPPAYPHESTGVSINNFLTAREVNHALRMVYAGQLLSPQLTAYLLEAMTNVKPGLNYLTGVLPPPALVSHKNGFFWDPEGWVDNDVAIVRFGPELQHAYAISFFSEAVPDLYADIPLGQGIVFEAWNYFFDPYR